MEDNDSYCDGQDFSPKMIFEQSWWPVGGISYEFSRQPMTQCSDCIQTDTELILCQKHSQAQAK